MTVRYNYNRQLQPPAPFLYVAVAAPHRDSWVERVPLLIDTGADFTVIPRRLSAELELVEFSEVIISGFRQAPDALGYVLVRLKIHEWEIEAAEVVLGDDNYGLLGRDVLNQFQVFLKDPF